MTKDYLKLAVNMFYDLQRIRIQTGGRILAKDNPQGIDLNQEDLEYFETIFERLKSEEKQLLKKIQKYVEATHIWKEFLKDIKGVGPTMAAVLLSEFDINKAETVSNMWSYAGLNVVDGKAPKPIKGEKLKYNKWLRSKLLGVLGTSFLKTNSSYRDYYDNYKNRLQSMRILCPKCEGKKTKTKCSNCSGTGTSPWGVSDKHRHNASVRYMVKMFLIDLYRKWRELEELPIRNLYQEQYLNHNHNHKAN
ncbi:MAG: transposase [Candidatus Hodarchaeota archaeon]